jgi:MFS transporter, DHA1 family, inner membrane transport protein
LLIDVAGIRESMVPLVLCVFGAGMIIGNVVGSRLADSALLPTIGGVLLWNAVMLGMLVFTAGHAWLAVINILLIGTGFAHVPALQTRLMDVAADAQTLPPPSTIPPSMSQTGSARGSAGSRSLP